ncbi:epoxide hydrolase family protein [Novosphingobium malaysiense]|uniref:Enterotoxin n=1 Tax=Novosphingobium malaysiense TaxID=1348853 RepID=A0A0B1ZJ56_9SPHN|nr:epoxide hydrolase family protein [Novosphingobium malaysiense]KHK89216.1 enterotoxin [Novosphingobium malaysiense]
MPIAARPFAISVRPAVLDRIAARLADTRIGYAPDGGGWQWGTDRDYLEEFVRYWRDDYDWRHHEGDLNRFPQFLAEIDGVDVHFYHVRGDGRQPLPILLTHGWPGSVVEFLAVIPRLVAAGFDVVVPSLPGFAFSGRPPQPIGPVKVAQMWRTLMTEALGYERFYAQGGDFGSGITRELGITHSDVTAAIHLNFFMGPPPASSDDPELAEYWQAVGALMEEESGYHHQQATRPQTLGLALHDNPVGWASWVLEKFRRWGDTGGEIESRFSKDHLITNLMTYLVTDNVMSSFWMYYGSRKEQHARAVAAGPVPVPTALAHFPAEFYPMPSRRLAEQAFNLARYTVMERGGHFAAMEEPGLFADDVIAFFAGRP